MFGSNKQMKLQKDHKFAACYSLLLLSMLLHLQMTTIPCCAPASNENIHRSNNFKAAGASSTPLKKTSGGALGKFDGSDEIFTGDKRKVNTGSNPLHNR